MDSGWAVVIGALVAFLGSVTAPIGLHALQSRKARNDQYRAEVGVALRAVADAALNLAQTTAKERSLAEFLQSETKRNTKLSSSKHADNFGERRLSSSNALLEAHTRSVAIGYDLTLLLRAGDVPIEYMARTTFMLAERRDYGPAIEIYGNITSLWYRGEISSKNAFVRYQEEIAARYGADVL